MFLVNIRIDGVRNLVSVDLLPEKGINILYGNNGSGKTSFLEALYYLSIGRSFRSASPNNLIANNSNDLQIFVHLQDEVNQFYSIGVSRDHTNNISLRLQGESIASHAQIAKLLPMQLFIPKDYRLLDDGSEYRRQFMDWGVFHVEHSFFSVWQKMKKLLKHRNALLKTGKSFVKEELDFWDREFVGIATLMHELRKSYINELYPYFSQTASFLLDGLVVEMRYSSGWDTSKSLLEILRANLFRDLNSGHTVYGPHKADLKFFIEKRNAKDMMSRGQQKLLLYALRLAQGVMLKEKAGKQCIYLIDDMPSELDADKRQKVLEMLNKVNAQVFITGIYANDFAGTISRYGSSMFHVEHGKIMLIS